MVANTESEKDHVWRAYFQIVYVKNVSAQLTHELRISISKD